MNKELAYHYKILGLQPGASRSDVKSVFRHWVKLYHPDRNNSPDAEIMYKEIRAAYETLLNSELPNETVIDSVNDYSNWTTSSSNSEKRNTDSMHDYSWTASSSNYEATNVGYTEDVTGIDDSKKKIYAIVFFSVVFVVATVVFFISLANIILAVYQTGRYEKTQAKVVSFLFVRNSGYDIPVIEYEVDGRVYKNNAETYNKVGIRRGSKVSIRYNPQNPNEYIIASYMSNSRIILLFWSFGMITLSLIILAREIKLFAELRVIFFNFIWGVLGIGAYLHMGINTGKFNPFAMVYETRWSLIPCLILGSFIGYSVFCHMKNKAAKE